MSGVQRRLLRPIFNIGQLAQGPQGSLDYELPSPEDSVIGSEAEVPAQVDFGKPRSSSKARQC
jgi:hypothetical protein